MHPRMFPKLDALENAARARGRLAVAVAYPCSNDSLAAALAARDDGIIDPILVGPRTRIEACANALNVSLEGVRWADTEDDPIASSRIAVALVGAGEANALMKGSQHTDELLGAVVSRDANLRTSPQAPPASPGAATPQSLSVDFSRSNAMPFYVLQRIYHLIIYIIPFFGIITKEIDERAFRRS